MAYVPELVLGAALTDPVVVSSVMPFVGGVSDTGATDTLAVVAGCH